MQEGGSEALNYQLITVLYAFIIEIMSQIWCWFLGHVFCDGSLSLFELTLFLLHSSSLQLSFLLLYSIHISSFLSLYLLFLN
jgi:hypothetical protein